MERKFIHPQSGPNDFDTYVKRIHNIDIKQILTDDTVPTDGNWDTRNQKSDRISFGEPDRRLSKLLHPRRTLEKTGNTGKEL